MGIMDTMKGVLDVIRKADNIELYRQVMDLQTEAYALLEENRGLKERLAVREQVTFKKNAYWRAEEGPFCSRCFDADGKLVRLHARRSAPAPWCPSCNKTASDPDAGPDEPGKAITEPPSPWT